MNVQEQRDQIVGGGRDQKVDFLAKILCGLSGVEIVDRMDGSQNWWMFRADAELAIKSLEGRGFQFGNGQTVNDK